jgi:hypothetical protein
MMEGGGGWGGGWVAYSSDTEDQARQSLNFSQIRVIIIDVGGREGGLFLKHRRPSPTEPKFQSNPRHNL